MRNYEVLIPLVVNVCVFGMFTVAIVLYSWYKIRKFDGEAALKQAMIAKGYSANEIVHVLTSGKGKLTNPAFDLPPAKPVKSVA